MKLFYIDPQSYNNLSIYDSSLLSNVKVDEIHYYHNVKYQCEPIPGVHHHPVFSYSDMTGIRKAASYAWSVLRIGIAAVRQRPDVVHIQWFRLFVVDSVLVMLLRCLGIRIVHTAHNVLPHHRRKSDMRHFAWYYGHVDAIIVHTERSRNELSDTMNVPLEKIHVIPHGLLESPADEKAVDARAGQLSQQLGTDGRIVFASIGFQNYYKGIDIITDAWLNNLSGSKDAMLLVVGKMEKVGNTDVTALAACDNVHVVDDMVSDVDFDAYLRLADIVLLPYRQISQSGVLLTALQRGKAVAVADVGGLTDPLRYAPVGWNMGEPTADNLASLLQHLLANPSEIERCNKNGEAFERIRKVYSWTAIGRATGQLYDNLKNISIQRQ